MYKCLFTFAVLACSVVCARPLAFYDIVPYAPGKEAETARAIIRTHQQSGLDTFLYSLTLDPRGYPAFDHVTASMESYRKLKAELKDAPVKLGILLQAILGHWPRVDEKIEPWQRTIDIQGNVKRFCVLDTRYQDYIRRTATALARERPCFILADDDVRAFSPKMECFCPLHTAEFNRRSGFSFTPEQYRQAVSDMNRDARVTKVCTELRDEIPMTTAALLREGIDAVDPSIPSGACTPGAEQLLAGPRARRLAGAGNPATLRLPNGQYAEIEPKDMGAFYMLNTQAFLDYYKKDIDVVLDEADTFPHTLYSRSGRSFITRLTLGIFSGLRGAKIWYVGMTKSGEVVPERYAEGLGRNQRRLRALATALDGSRPTGLRVPAFLRKPTLEMQYPDFFGDSLWPERILGFYGIPFYADFSRQPGEPLLLGGTNGVARLSDAELKDVLRGHVLIDGPAALALQARGFGEYLGCRPKADGLAFNIERVRADGLLPQIAKSVRVPALTDVASTADVYSDLLYSPTGAADLDRAKLVAAGSLLYSNPAGGRVFVASFDPRNFYTAQNLRRKAWLMGALRKLEPKFPAICVNAEPNLTAARLGKDGRTYLYTVNLSYDDMASIAYVAPRELSGLEMLGEDGQWHRVGAIQKGEQWHVPHRLPFFDFVLLRY